MVNLLNSFRYAWAGIIYCFQNERNMKIHSAAAVLAVTLGVICRLQALQWGLLFITIMAVLVAELVNTAIEKTVDLSTRDFNPLAKTAKNVAAGAVLAAACNSVVMGLIIFGPYVLDFVRRWI
ncbi:MAG: diacylglycerol kinase family protein [Syntrophomonadaceae bacterium]|nr:diacylglycerol kinase family protein [Syntrophomonadaceae bacterium]